MNRMDCRSDSDPDSGRKLGGIGILFRYLFRVFLFLRRVEDFTVNGVCADDFQVTQRAEAQIIVSAAFLRHPQDKATVSVDRFCRLQPPDAHRHQLLRCAFGAVRIQLTSLR